MPSKQEIRAAFALYDTNGDGQLSPDELKAIMCKAVPGGTARTEEEVDALVKQFDADGDGMLSMEEIAGAWAVMAIEETVAAAIEAPETEGEKAAAEILAEPATEEDAAEPPPGSNVDGYLVEGGPANEYLRGLWKAVGATKGIDEGDAMGDVQAVVGANGRSLLGGKEREVPFQVVVSFPGAGFNFKFVDPDGESQASSGFGLALAFRSWIGDETFKRYGADALLGCEKEGILLSHFYMDWANLQYVPGTTRVTNFRNRGAENTASINPNWKFYYVEAQLECVVMIVLITSSWLVSPNCIGELDEIDDFISKKANADQSEMLLVVLEDAVYESPIWQGVAAKAAKWETQFHNYTETTAASDKQAVEDHIFSLIDDKCQLKRTAKPGVPSGNKEVDWDDAAMG